MVLVFKLLKVVEQYKVRFRESESSNSLKKKTLQYNISSHISYDITFEQCTMCSV